MGNWPKHRQQRSESLGFRPAQLSHVKMLPLALLECCLPFSFACSPLLRCSKKAGEDHEILSLVASFVQVRGEHKNPLWAAIVRSFKDFPHQRHYIPWRSLPRIVQNWHAFQSPCTGWTNDRVQVLSPRDRMLAKSI